MSVTCTRTHKHTMQDQTSSKAMLTEVVMESVLSLC